MADMGQAGRKTVRPFSDGCPACLGDGLQHALEHPLVQRVKNVPVCDSQKPPRKEAGELLELRRAAVEGVNPEIQQGLAGNLHFGQELEPIGLLDLQHAPKVQRISRIERRRMPSAPPEPDAAGNPVTEDDERRKLALVVEAARQFWP